METPPPTDPETQRLDEARHGVPWRMWGPYLAERQWGTVREDYSTTGDAWSFLSHDQARSTAYRWGEDGIAGLSDDRQLLCLALALWNGHDPIIKERMFGLTNAEGNHGEDVKEYYHYLDATPTGSYLRCLYRYPQAAYPYADLVRTNAGRSRLEPEYELVDTGVFDQGWFDVVIEYAKEGPQDISMRVTVQGHGGTDADLVLLPTAWARNTWHDGPSEPLPALRAADTSAGPAIAITHPLLGERLLMVDPSAQLVFTNNETNTERVSGTPNRQPYVKDAFHRYLIEGDTEAIDPRRIGTKAAVLHRLRVPANGTAVIRLRFTDEPAGASLADVDAIIERRRAEADAFYASVIPGSLDEDHGRIMRQALAGMLWSRQFYRYDVDQWLTQHGADPWDPVQRVAVPRNAGWSHLDNADVISMPDTWEYPWYAAWDLAFHVLALTLVDEDFAKDQLALMLRQDYLHPNGQLPAYEWNFGDVNPPVHAWATIFTYRLERARRGVGDVEWLERMFHKLALNFTWWVNRKDRTGSNLFEGGFLGLDNIGVFDRSAPLPTGGYLEQADGTAWMALFSQNMLEIAGVLALERPVYVDMTLKFVEHSLRIATAMMHGGADTGMWDEEDGFFYDVLRRPDGTAQRLKVRSMVGLLPLCAVTVFEGALLERRPEVAEQLRRLLAERPELRAFVHDPALPGVGGRRMAAVLDETHLRRVLARMLDEAEFLSPFGIRSLSRYHAEHPYVFRLGDQESRVSYLPAESDSGMFGGNSNWRGPIWMPVNALIIRALLQYHQWYGDAFTIECPTGSGRMLTLAQVAEEIGRRLTAIFLRDPDGRRPVFGDASRFQDDPAWRDDLLFYEYFHGDDGAGLGASHQTGWTGVIARIIHLFARTIGEA